MRRLGLVALACGLTAGCGSTHTVVRTVTVERKGEPSDQRLFGTVRSLVRTGDHYVLRFDPALFLSGIAANVAAAEDEGIRCRPTACPPVANDNYVVDEGHRLLTFVVPAGVRGTVLTRRGSGSIPSTPIGVAELARIVAGRSRLNLFEPLSSGVWIVVHGDAVRSFAQQYRP